jgi:preprotein translocase subunit SecA
MCSASTISLAPNSAYPERNLVHEGRLERIATAAVGPLVRRARLRGHRFDRFLKGVEDRGRKLERLDGDELSPVIHNLRDRLRREGIDKQALVAESFALVREIAHRKLEMRHYDVQLMGGLLLLKGMVAEMETGEGKTLTATLPACTAALAGMHVHIITVNDYLAARDATWMGPVYDALGLSVGTIIQGMEADERRKAYACDVTYCTNKELAFDYLKDRILLGRRLSRARLSLESLCGEASALDRLLLRGLCFAIVDEVDSILIDEARTPLIISGNGSGTDEQQLYEQALAIANQLDELQDFEIRWLKRRIRLTEAGETRIAEIAKSLTGLWSGRRRREELVRQALAAQHLYIRDKHYLVRQGKIQIIDENTGRAMPDRSWELGLHQMIELKEDCEMTSRRETIARTTYQRLFRRYLRLGGMTGTASEVAAELWSVYRLCVASVPTHRPLRRTHQRTRVYVSANTKWETVVERISSLHARGRPVLIGTRSVAASEHLSGLLTANNLAHQVLNARQNEEEAEVVRGAGEYGQITVSTSMAGRGTDIKLASGVATLGGLHVILTELHDAKRIDRQLMGRCGRQGDRGSYEVILSLDDELVITYVNGIIKKLTKNLAGGGYLNAQWLLRLVVRRAQISAERFHYRARQDLMKMEEQLDTALAFSGHLE